MYILRIFEEDFTKMKKIFKALLLGCVVIAGLGIMHNCVEAKDAQGNVIVVIDPGHGGDDPGTKATTGAYEKDCNLAIAEAMKTELETYDGIKVYFTRSGDEWMSNTGRSMMAAALHADFLISVHNNSGSHTNTGALAYRSLNQYYSESTNDMCSLILENLAALGLANGGVQTRTATDYDYEDYYTLIGEGVRVGVPSIIIEHCFLSNPTDAAYISNSDGTVNAENAKAMGIADATGVATYFKLSKREAQADDDTTVELEKSYGVTLSVPGSNGDGATWYSIDKTVATVDDNGVVTAVGVGTTNIAYKLGDESASCTITVKEPEAIALVGGINPTFYDDSEDMFSSIDTSKAFGFVMYSDGSSKKVQLDSVGTVDTSLVGIQDVQVKYGDLTGSLRLVHNNSEYKPEVTLPAPTEPSIETSADDNTVTKNTSTSNSNSTSDDKSETIKEIIKYAIIVVIVIIIGIILFIIESNRRRRRHRRGRRRY